MKYSDIKKKYGIGTVATNLTTKEEDEEKKKTSGNKPSYSDIANKHGISTEVDEDYVNKFLSDANSFFSSAEKDYSAIGWGNASSSYTSKKSTYDDLDIRSVRISNWLKQNKDRLDEETYKSLSDAIATFDTNASSVIGSFREANDYYSQWETEDDYKAAVKEYEEYEKMLSFDWESELIEVDSTQAYLDAAKEYRKYYSSLETAHETGDMTHLVNYYVAEGVDRTTAYFWVANPQKDEMRQKMMSYVDKYGHDKLLSDTTDLQNDTNNRRAYANSARYNQLAPKLESEAKANADFATVVASVNIDEVIKASKAEWMEDDEKQTYAYYIGIGDQKTADEYMYAIKESINQRKAADTFESLEDKTALEFLYGAWAGLDQFGQGMANIFRNDYYIPASATQMTSGMVREDLADVGFDLPDWLGGASLGQGVYDTITTTANMTPSILISFIPYVGQVAGAVTLGASAAGHARAEAINLGYDKETANTYGLLIGGSEATLQYVLGGIGKLGGVGSKAVGKAVTNTLGNLDNAFFRVAAKFGNSAVGKWLGNMASEAGEEYLQALLEPVIRNALLNENNTINPTDPEALYSAVLGAVSAGFLESGGLISAGNTAIGDVKRGARIEKAGATEDLVNFVKNTLSADSVAGEIASKVNENTGAYTIGKLLREAGASLSEQNRSDIEAALIQKGMTERDAKKISKWLNNAVNGGKFTKSQAEALENNEVISQVFYDVIIGQNSTVYQRSIEYSDLYALAKKKSGVKATDAETAVEEPTTPTSNPTAMLSNEELDRRIARAMGIDESVVSKSHALASQTPSATNSATATKATAEGKFKVSDDGKTIRTSTGEDVSIKGIASNKGGTLMLELEDGNTVNAKDLSFGTREEALLYEMVTNMEVSPQTAKALIKGFNASDGVSAESYVIDIPIAYRYGKINYEKGLEKLHLTAKQKYTAFVRGRDDMKANGRTWSNTSRRAGDITTAKASEDGIIYEDFELNEESLTDIQKASLAGVRTIAKMSTLEIHIYNSFFENGKRYAIVNGQKRVAPNGYFRDGNRIFIDINAGNRSMGTMLYTLAHEATHSFAERNWDDFLALADFLFEEYGNHNVPVEDLINREITKLKKSYKRDGKQLPSENDLYMKAYEEVVADAMSEMFADSNAYVKLAKLKSQNLSLWQKIGEVIKMLLDKLESLLGVYSDLTPDAMAAHYVKDFSTEVRNKLQDLYLKAFVQADENFTASIGSRNLEEFAEAKNTDGESLFQYKAMEADEDTYRDMLKKWGKMTDSQISNLFLTIDEAMEIIKGNLEALDYAWESDINDRGFSPVKPNSDKLYQVSLDFSTLCRKRILQQMVQVNLQEALDKTLTREEGIAIRDALIAIQEEGRQIEVACALCYVESARMKSPEQIQRFINNKEKVIKEFFAGKSGGSMQEKLKQAEVDARAKLHEENPNGIKGKDGVTKLDPRTATLKELPKKYADAIRSAKKAAKESYTPTAKEQAIIETAKGMKVSDFTSPEGLENLAKNHRELFDAYTSYVRNATKSKGIEADTWWRAGDSMQIGDVLIANMNKENGLRSQSWSDFQVIHILDYIAATIELATRNTKEQAYSKVPDYAELMGNTGVMINLSLIPTAKFNGKLEYDSVEGIDYKRSLELRDKYHATVGTICIGVDNVQIKMLLADSTIDYVIPYHKSGMSKAIRKLMHIPTWEQYEGYQSEKNLSRSEAQKQADKYGVKLLAENDPNYQKGTSFSEWFDIKEAQQIAKMENANPSDKAKQKKYGVMYGGYMAMQNAANNYLKLCAERGISPKFSHEKADFTAEENYWKLLIDRKMVDNITGEVVEQQTIKPIFDQNEVMRILNDELDRYPKVKADQEYAVRKVTEAYLSGKLKSGMSAEAIAKIVQTPVDNVTTTNVVASAEHNPRLTDADLDEYMKVGKRQHTRNRKRELLESGKKPILTTSAEVVSFMSKVIRGEAVNEIRAFARVGARLANEILHIDSTLDVFGDYLELHADNLRESYTKHSSPKEAGDIPLSDTDFARIPDYLDDFDGVLLTNTHNNKKEVHLYKETDEGYIRILAVSSNERGSLMVTKLIGVSKEKFEGKYAKKIERNIAKTRGQTDFSETSNPPTEARRTANALSKTKIPQSDKIVNRESEDSDTNYSESDYAPTFYSHMGKVVDGIKSEKVGATGVVSYLKGKGVKDEEIKWSGIEAFLEGKKSVTKAELQEFIAGSMLQIEEQMSGKDIDLRYDGSKRAYNLYDEKGNIIDTFTYNEFMDGYVADSDEEIYSNEIELRKALIEDYGKADAPRWAEYRLDGGENYRELVFKLPNSTYTNAAMRGHWGEDAEGVLAHARIQDMTTSDGKKMLFIEEIQSDWHNEGSKRGYVNESEFVSIKNTEVREYDVGFMLSHKGKDILYLDEDASGYDPQMKHNRELAHQTMVDLYNESKSYKQGDPLVTDAPFRNTYHEYVLKRLIRMAAEQGYDAIGWTTAQMQSDRWSSEYAEGYRIEYDQDMPKFLRKYGKKWGATVDKTALSGTKPLSETIYDVNSAKVYRSMWDWENAVKNDLRSKGLSGREANSIEFKMDGQYLIAYGKDGAEYGRAKVFTEDNQVWSMDITDSMTESVLYEGQVLYSEAVTDQETLDFLENQEHITTYKSFVEIDGKLYSPMATKVKGEDGKYRLTNPSQIGVWQQAEEKPDSIPKFHKTKGYGYYVLKKDDGGTITAAYNPYEHSSNLVLNDQFEAAYQRPNLVTVECIIPKSEMTSGYKAKYAKDSTGYLDWKSGTVASKLKGNKRKVYLSRWLKPVRILSDAEVASMYKEILGAQISVPFNVVTPQLRTELEKVGVKIDYEGSPGYQYRQNKKATDADTNYSEQDTDSMSNRSLLANALESVAQNDIERNKLAQYKAKLALIESEQAKLSEIRRQANELRFTKGRTADETKRMRELDFEANQIANRINTYDRQLFNLESTSALKGVLDREKQMAKKKAEKRSKEILAAQREKSAQAQRELLTRHQESRKKAIENRHKTEMRHKIKSVVSDLNNLLLHGSKERNVKLGLQAAVASALEAVNMDTVAADERIAKLREELMRAKTPEKIQEISRKIDNIQAQGDAMASRLEELRRAYAEIKNSDENIPEHYKQEASLIADKVDSVMTKVGNTPLRNMSLAQLEAVYELYKIVLTTVRNANSVFKQGKLDDLHKNVSAIMMEVSPLKTLKEERKAVGDWWRKQSWNEMIPVYAFERIGSKTLTSFFWETIRGQNTFAVDINEAKEFSSATRDKYGYGKWDLDKIHEFKLADGRTFRVSLRHMMSIYAYSKREQALEHMRVGGFFFNDKSTFRKEKGIFKIIKSNEEGYYVDDTVLASIKDAMTKEQLLYVDEMQDYLTKMGEKGNEVSRVLWGIDIFKEKVYFPLKSSKDFIYQSNQPTQASSLKNDGMTKETKPGASNPIMLEAFDDVWASHVNRMSQYHAFVLPIENLNKIHNYGSWVGTASMSLSTMLRARHGDAVNEYIEQFIQDLNGASSMHGVSNPLFRFVSKFKKTAVAASTSVVVQQPTAILRALAVMDSKYFVGMPKMQKLSTKWGELQKYAPIAIIKEIGGFDAGGGRQATEWLNSNTRRGLDKVMGKVDDLTMMGAALGDRIGWCTIWEAVKRETKATTNLKEGSEEFLKKAGERFTEVIVLTQVYDSTLSRSGFMRSQHESMKMLTSFMGEPTVSFNMMMNAVVQAKRKTISKLKAGRIIGSVYASIIAASVASSLIYALRDDDDDESYLEKFAEAFGDKLISDINPLNMLPIMRDIVSIGEGWDVERTDMALIQDLKDAFDGLSSENKSAWRKTEDFAGAFAHVFNVPLKNTLRTGREVYNLFKNIFDDVKPSGVGDAFVRGITGEKKDKGKALYEAIVNNDEARLKIYRANYKDDKSYENAVRSALRENDPRIKEAAQARIDGDIAEYTRIARQIISEGYFKQDTVVAAINAEINALKKGENTESSTPSNKVESIFTMDDYYKSIVGKDQASAHVVKEDIIKAEVANGKDREEAEANFNSRFASHLREQYEEGYISKYEAENMLVNYGGKSEEDAASKVQYWEFKKRYPDYDLSEEAVKKYYEEVEPSGIKVSVYYDYSKQRAKCKGTDSDGDGKTDSGSVKREVLKVIDSLPITYAQKDVLYYLNGWSQSTIWEAPWH